MPVVMPPNPGPRHTCLNFQKGRDGYEIANGSHEQGERDQPGRSPCAPQRGGKPELKQQVADLNLDKHILQDVPSKEV